MPVDPAALDRLAAALRAPGAHRAAVLTSPDDEDAIREAVAGLTAAPGGAPESAPEVVVIEWLTPGRVLWAIPPPGPELAALDARRARRAVR